MPPITYSLVVRIQGLGFRGFKFSVSDLGLGGESFQALRA